MLRLLRSRPLALLAGLWFLVAGREPPFPHPCEMGGMGAVAGAAAADEHAHHRHEETVPDGCECVDDCCISVVAQVTGTEELAGLPLVPRVKSRISAVAARVIDVAPRLLPFANGPPELS